MGVTAEAYGFVSWFISWVALDGLILWALVPTETMQRFDIDFLPSKWWIAVGSSLLVHLVLAAAVGSTLAAYVNAPPLTSPSLFQDNMPITDDLSVGKLRGEFDKISEPMDISLNNINRMMFAHNEEAICGDETCVEG